MDVDEEALRAGSISPRLHGYLRVPVEPGLLQGGKARTAGEDRAAQAAIAGHVVDRVLDEPALPRRAGDDDARDAWRRSGSRRPCSASTSCAAASSSTADADEERCSSWSTRRRPAHASSSRRSAARGSCFGRGNQQLSAARARAGRHRRTSSSLATETKLAALGGRAAARRHRRPGARRSARRLRACRRRLRPRGRVPDLRGIEASRGVGVGAGSHPAPPPDEVARARAASG